MAGHYQGYVTLGAEIFMLYMSKRLPPEHTQVGFICYAHNLKASTGQQGAATCCALFNTDMAH